MGKPEVGAIIDRRYLLKREIARGGTAVVLEAVHQFTERPLAVKMLLPQRASDDDSRQRLLIEARALTWARHPNVVAVLDAGTDVDGVPYLVMEMLDGRSLDGILIARGTMSVENTLSVGAQLADALAHVHSRGLIHRDVKPGNIFLARTEVGVEALKLVDFGIASLGDGVRREGTEKLTIEGDLIGTPEYMAPEQLMMADHVDHRADVYSMAVVLYECLSGTVPFGGNYPQVLVQLSSSPAPSLLDRNPALTPALCAVVMKGLLKNPDDRFQDVRAFARALVEASGVTPRPTTLLGLTPAMEQARPPSGSPPQKEPPTAPPRRRYARAPYVTPVRMVIDRTILEGHSQDISAGGLLVLLSEPRQLSGEGVTVTFALPATGEIATVAAIARWLRTARGQGALGIEFVDPPPGLVETVDAYVTSLGGER